MLGAYSRPWLSPPAPHDVNNAAAESPTNMLCTKRIVDILRLFKTLFIYFRSTGFFNQLSKLFFAFTIVQVQVNGHHVLIICAAQVKLAGPLVWLQVTYNQEGQNHTVCSK